MGASGTKKGQSSVEKFLLAHVAYEGDDCVLWPFSTDQDGYGNYNWGRATKAHRKMCEIAHGLPPKPGFNASHSCHNRACINPRHLSWKTFSQNMLDKRGNSAVKFAYWGRKGKLNHEAVRQIRALAGVQSRLATARQFNITASNVRHIQERLTWKHVADEKSALIIS